MFHHSSAHIITILQVSPASSFNQNDIEALYERDIPSNLLSNKENDSPKPPPLFPDLVMPPVFFPDLESVVGEGIVLGDALSLGAVDGVSEDFLLGAVEGE